MDLTRHGVTLLAFGNGAPDVFSSIAAAKQDQIALSIGGVIGESLFITSIVLASCICVAGPITVKLAPFLRDAGVFLFAVMLLGLYWLEGEISFLKAMVFPVMYIGYVLVVLYTDKEPASESTLSQPLELQEIATTAPITVSWGEIREDYFSSDRSDMYFPKATSRPAHAIGTNLKWSLIRMNWWLAKKYPPVSQRTFHSFTLFEKTIYILTFPLLALRKLTIPLYLEDEDWNRTRAAVTPPLSLVVVLLVLGCKR